MHELAISSKWLRASDFEEPRTRCFDRFFERASTVASGMPVQNARACTLRPSGVEELRTPWTRRASNASGLEIVRSVVSNARGLEVVRSVLSSCGGLESENSLESSRCGGLECEISRALEASKARFLDNSRGLQASKARCLEHSRSLEASKWPESQDPREGLHFSRVSWLRVSCSNCKAARRS